MADDRHRNGPYPATDSNGRPVELTIYPGLGHLVPKRTTGVSLGLETVPLRLVAVSGRNVRMNTTTYTLDDPADADKLAAAIKDVSPATSTTGRSASDQLARLGKLVQIIAFVFAVWGLIVGAVIGSADGGASQPTPQEVRVPYLAYGLCVAVGAVMIAVVMYAIGALCVYNATAGKRTRY